MGQVIYTGSISGNYRLDANGTDSVTVYLSQTSGSFPSSYTITNATLYLSRFHCYSTSKGIDLYLDGSKVNGSEMCGSEITDNGDNTYYAISGTWNLNTSANYENVSSARIVSRAHSADTTSVMSLRDGCQVKITVTYTEGSSGGDSGGGNTGGGDTGGGNTGDPITPGTPYTDLYNYNLANVHLSKTVSEGEEVVLTWNVLDDFPPVFYSMYVNTYASMDLETWYDISNDVPWTYVNER